VLDSIHPWGGRVRPFRSHAIETCVASEPWQLSGYWRLRRQIFSEEQQLFPGSDRDEKDESAVPIVALSLSAGMPDAVVGVVRIYPSGSSEWYGGRLGVSPLYRRHGVVGESLIRAAVGTAKGAGSTRFLATVQLGNVRYFTRHHFRVLGRESVCGVPHAVMQANLEAFRALPCPEPRHASEVAA
jgi:putative N-acetyltransferase (TIGR04045 family)